MTEIESVFEKVESGKLFTVSVSYENDSLRQVLVQILQKVQKNSDAIVVLNEGRTPAEIPTSVSEDQGLKTRLANLEERLINLERKQATPTLNPDPYFMSLIESEESKELSKEDIVGMIKSLKRETDQRVSKLDQELKQFNLNPKQPSVAAEKSSAFEYNRSKLLT
jgi:ribosomal protein L29